MEQIRQYYEAKLNRRVSDSHWWKIKKTLKDAGFELTESNLNHYLELRKYCPRYTASLGLISAKLKTVTNYIRSNISGNHFQHYLANQGIKPSQSTFSRWFKAVGGYRRDRLYTAKELTVVAMAAFTYQIKEEQKKSHRAS